MKKLRIITIFSILLVCCGCRKLVEIPQPVSTVTSAKVFNNEASAEAAIVGIYNNMVGNINGLTWSSGSMTIYAGLSSDELGTTLGYIPYLANSILPDDPRDISQFWTPAYYNIYQANAAIEALQASAGVSAAKRNELIGEAKFVRAFTHFYLVNLYGDVPLVTKSTWFEINLLPRSPVADVYKQIILDLKDAQSLLPKDYPASTGGEKIRPNYWAATAMLARVYLYQNDWKDAFEQSAAIINSGAYALEPDLNNVFLKNSSEAIFQLQPVNGFSYSTPEGNALLPTMGRVNFFPPDYIVTDQLLASFESGDQRLVNWVHAFPDYSGTLYNALYKYKVHKGTPDNITEYYMVLRFAEQYLIRAEAEANGATGGDQAAIADLNVIRARAGLTALGPLSHDQVIAAVAQERRVELFAEWGHRWFDLKRTGQADAVLSALKSTYTPNAKLWPIPFSELSLDPNLVQNPGYH